MLGANFCRRGEFEQLAIIHAVGAHNLRHGWLASRVRVPVFTITMALMRRAPSALQRFTAADQNAVLGRFAVPTMIAVGVASPSARQQAIISTEIAA
jgi:hypothetical protein